MLLVRSRYQITMSATDTAKISVEMALISGVMPRRSRPQISRGSVLSRPIRKNVTAISSMDSVKISNPAATSDSFRFGSVTRQNVCQGVAPRSREASSCARSSFCSPAKSSVVATEISAVPCPRNTVNRLSFIPAKTANISSERPVMMPGSISGSSTSRRNSALPGKRARSSASAASKPSVSESTTLPAATSKLLTTASQMAESENSWRYHSIVKCRGGKPPTPSRLKEYKTRTTIGK